MKITYDIIKDGLITASFKNPKKRKLVYLYYLSEKDIPKEIFIKNKIYFLYGIH